MIVSVPVEALRPGDVLLLPSGQTVNCERVDEYPDGDLMVRWWRPARRGEPGWRGALGYGTHALGSAGVQPLSGRYLGSFAPKRRGDLIRVKRGR
jgi:hypothetical protein